MLGKLMETSKEYCTIYVARHGQTEFNVRDILQGQVDSPLTDDGRLQAKELSTKLTGIHFEAIFSSDLGRAKRTAEIIALDRELAVITKKLLRERSFGHLDGTAVRDFREQNRELFKKRETLSEQEKRDFKFYETYESDSEIAARMLTALREIAATYIGKNILVVSHGAIIRSMLIHLGFADFDELDSKSVGNASYVKLESDGVDFFIKETIGISKSTHLSE